MNVFMRELKAYRKGLFFWSIGMIALVGSGMAKYATYQSTGQSLIQLTEKFPHALQVIFGLSGFDLATASGFYGVLFLYIAIMAAVHAVLLGSDIIAKEERDRTSEFLFVKPKARAGIISSKLLAGIVNLIVFNLVTLASSIIVTNSVAKSSSATKYICLLMAGLFFLQLLFFFVGTAIAAISKKPKASASIATSILLATFILYFLINFNAQWDFLQYLTPFKYFDALSILNANHLNPGFLLLSLAITVGLGVTTYAGYLKRDLEV